MPAHLALAPVAPRVLVATRGLMSVWNPDGTGIAVAAYRGITPHALGK
ncbi:hypothetical protein N8560_00880 [bacterium]|nr:hypothetical protein [bacterium]MDA7622415.1 hypothetical protein [Verrucomicrobiota bacterium]